ncbi:PREDICTED: nucleolar protein 16 isoform X2 [Hipposideros armiger]|uniref:Nucleolar protein 16 n=1 Tax=Hipposideros armiger TaxID=186990 RepID=A0A8B7SGT9_HIPAR|nr:PREDICTED: nucleolar protein 16 isoform X2 [Hipposideros armiger]
MPKAKGKTRRQKFGYNVNRKRLNRNARRKAAPRIECSHIRHAWDHAKSVRQNLAEMGLAMDPNKAVPLRKRKVKAMEVDLEGRPQEIVRKPYVLNDLEVEASLPEKKGNTLSRDLIDYVRYMVENHGEDYKQSGKPLLNLCRRLKWRSSDWFMFARLRPPPGPEKLESGCKARRGVWLQMRLAKPHGIKRFFSLSLPSLGKELTPRGSNLYSSGASKKSQNLLFSEWVVCLNTVCT